MIITRLDLFLILASRLVEVELPTRLLSSVWATHGCVFVVQYKTWVPRWVVSEAIDLIVKVFWNFKFLIIHHRIQLVLGRQCEWLTISMSRFFLILKEIQSAHVFPSVDEGSWGFRLVDCQLSLETLVHVKLTVGWRHVCHLTTVVIDVGPLTNFQASYTSNHRRMISWRVCLS